MAAAPSSSGLGKGVPLHRATGAGGLVGRSPESDGVAQVSEGDLIAQLDEEELWSARIFRASGLTPGGATGSCGDPFAPLELRDSVFHLVQNSDELEQIFAEELPPDS